jgi:mono/diheme cytochrome c family protein
MEEGEATATPEPEEEALSPEAEAGQYLITISRGCGCHFNSDLGGMAGGAFAFHPGGDEFSVYPANVTPHEETGIGSWTPEDVATAIRTGVRPDGTQLHPIMPYMAFSHLSDEDAMNIGAYLLSQEPIENDVPDRVLESDPEPFTPDPAPPATAPTDPVERGEYLARLSRCGDCHTPRNEDGTQNMEMFLAGNRISDDEVAWNITPHEETGIGLLSEEEIATFLRTGMFADGSQVAGTMGMNIENFYSHLTEEDALAIAAFLKSIPPVENEPE